MDELAHSMVGAEPVKSLKHIPIINEEGISRLRRIETRLVRLCQHMGLNATPGKVRMVLVSESPPMVEVLGLDVSLGDILAFLSKRSIKGAVVVEYQGRWLGTIQETPLEAP